MTPLNHVVPRGRQATEERVLDLLRAAGALSRSEIAARLGLSRATLSEITTALLGREAIVVRDTDALRRAGAGRPAELLALNPLSGRFLGVDLGHRRVQVAVADAAHDVVAAGRSDYDVDSDMDHRIAAAFDVVDRLRAETGVHVGGLQGVAIGVAGPFAPQRGAGRVPAAAERQEVGDLVERAFAERYGAPVLVDNNTRFAAVAEALSSRSSAVRDLVYVRLSDGVGGGLVVDGRLVTGWSGYAGELGHVVVDPSGPDCRCGKRGCLETLASVPAVLAACRASGVAVSSLDDLRAQVERADPLVHEVLRLAGIALGRVLSTAAVMLNPAEIVVGGELARIAPVLMRQVERTLTYELYSFRAATPSLRTSGLTDEDGALGALAALFHESPLLADYRYPTGPAASPRHAGAPAAAQTPAVPAAPRRDGVRS